MSAAPAWPHALDAMRTEGIEITFLCRSPSQSAPLLYAPPSRPSRGRLRGRQPAIGSSHRHHYYGQSLEADNLNLRATVRRQTHHIADLEARLLELLGEKAYSRTGLGAPRNHAALEDQNHTLQNEIQELQAKLQDQEEELGEDA